MKLKCFGGIQVIKFENFLQPWEEDHSNSVKLKHFGGIQVKKSGKIIPFLIDGLEKCYIFATQKSGILNKQI